MKLTCTRQDEAKERQPKAKGGKKGKGKGGKKGKAGGKKAAKEGGGGGGKKAGGKKGKDPTVGNPCIVTACSTAWLPC